MVFHLFSSRRDASGPDAALVYDFTVMYSDPDPSTWEKVDISLSIPSNTTFLGIGILAEEDIYNDYSYPEFDGHFADCASITVIPESATILFFTIGIFALGRKK